MRTLTGRDGRRYPLRPIAPTDAAALQRAFARMDYSDQRTRLFAPTRELSDAVAAAFCAVDGVKDICLVIEDPDAPGELGGGCRLMADPLPASAEFSVSLRSDLKGRGLGRALMEALLAEARDRGLIRVWGTILRTNAAMVGLCRKLGFKIAADPDDRTVVKAVWTAPA